MGFFVKSRWRLLAGVSVLFVCASAVVVSVRSWQARQRAAQNRQIFLAIQAALPKHTSREDADRYLEEHDFGARLTFGPGSMLMDDFVDIGKHEGGDLFCGYEQAAVFIHFVPRGYDGPAHYDKVLSQLQPKLDDEVSVMDYQYWPMDCL